MTRGLVSMAASSRSRSRRVVFAHHRDERVLDADAADRRRLHVDAVSFQELECKGSRVDAAARGEPEHMAVVRDLVHLWLLAEQLRGLARLVRRQLERLQSAALDDLLGRADIEHLSTEDESQAMAAL